MIDAVKVYFDTMLYLDKFEDTQRTKPETRNMFNKVKDGNFRLIISQTVMMEIYHVLCLPVQKAKNHDEALRMMETANTLSETISKNMLALPYAEFVDNEFDKIEPRSMIDFVKTYQDQV